MTTYPNARRGDIWFVTDDALGGCSESDRTIHCYLELFKED